MVLDGCFHVGYLVPHLEAILHEGTVIPGSEIVPFGPKVIQDWPKSGEKPLSLSRGFEASHGSLSLPRRLMQTFRSIVQPFVLAVLYTGHNFPLCGCVAGQLVGDDHSWDILESFEQFSKKLPGRLLVASALHENVQDVAVLINRSP